MTTACRPNHDAETRSPRQRRPAVKLATNWMLVEGQTDLWKTELEVEQERSQKQAARSARIRKTGLYSFFAVIGVVVAGFWVTMERMGDGASEVLPIEFAEVPMLVSGEGSTSK